MLFSTNLCGFGCSVESGDVFLRVYVVEGSGLSSAGHRSKGQDAE